MSKFLPNQNVSSLKYTFGTKENTVVTLPAVAAATQGDYVRLYNDDGTSRAFYINIDGDNTAPTGALYVAATSKAALNYLNDRQETYVLTCGAGSAVVQGDFVVIYDAAGTSTAVWLDKDAAGTEPDGTTYTGTDVQIEVDILAGDTATQVATKVHTAISGVIADITFTDNLDGTITVLLDDNGAAIDAISLKADESAKGSFTVGTITKGQIATTAETAAALLVTLTPLTNTEMIDNLDGTITVKNIKISDATDAVVKNTDDSAAGSIVVESTDGSLATFPYENPSDTPSVARKVDPVLFS